MRMNAVTTSDRLRCAAVLSGLLLPSLACEHQEVEPQEEFAAGADITTRVEIDPEDLCPNVINDGIGLMRYCRNRNIYTDNTNVERAIIVIHGSELDAKNYYNTTVTQAGIAGADLNKTDIIAPQFFQGLPVASDPTGIFDDYYVWDGAWRYGDDAVTHARSSYEVIDHIIGQLVDHRPNLQMIVIAGQSAGGQFVERYAVGTKVSTPGIAKRFWAANPGAYMWYTSARPDATCTGYDDYPRGMVARNEYMSQYTVAQLKSNAFTRDIFWTVGEYDVGTSDWHCKDLAQGAHRQDRWANHQVHIADVCNSLGYAGLFCLVHAARHIEIDNCGHGHACSWNTDEGRDILFGP